MGSGLFSSPILWLLDSNRPCLLQPIAFPSFFCSLQQIPWPYGSEFSICVMKWALNCLMEIFSLLYAPCSFMLLDFHICSYFCLSFLFLSLLIQFSGFNQWVFIHLLIHSVSDNIYCLLWVRHIEIMLERNCVGEDSWEPFGLQGYQASQFLGKSVLNILWKDWWWSWNYNTLVTWCEELTHWKRPWCWERLKAGEKGDDRGWDGQMTSPTQWTWVWVNSGSWWWTGKPGVPQSTGSQRVRHDLATELAEIMKESVDTAYDGRDADMKQQLKQSIVSANMEVSTNIWALITYFT